MKCSLILMPVLLAGLAMSAPSQAFCFNEAGARYHQDPRLLRAIAIVESQLNPRAIGINRSNGRSQKSYNTSHDLGLMQINDRHVPQLLSLGIIKDQQELLTNPCLNVQVGAWILARSIKQCGPTWQCLGAYNAGFRVNNAGRRLFYARKVWRVYQYLVQKSVS